MSFLFPGFAHIADSASSPEREQAAERAEIARLERERRLEAARVASAYAHAFQVGKESKGAKMRSTVEKFDLDVTKPQKLNQQGKKASTAKSQTQIETDGFETMLHVAAVHCDPETVDFLIARGKLSYLLPVLL